MLISKNLKDSVRLHVYKGTELLSGSLHEQIAAIEKIHFGDTSFSKDDFIRFFNHPECVVVIALEESSGEVIGFTFSRPTIDVYEHDRNPERLPEVRKLDGKSAYIDDIAIRPDYLGHGLTPLMVGELEKVLIAKGYKYFEEDAAVENGYADKVEKAYKKNGRLIFVGEQQRDSDYGLQRFFRIKL